MEASTNKVSLLLFFRYVPRLNEQAPVDGFVGSLVAHCGRVVGYTETAEFVFALNTGLRLGSQYAATYEMMDLKRNVLDIPRTKKDEAVHVPLNSDVLAALRSLSSWTQRRGAIFRNQKHPEKPVLSNDHWFKPALVAAVINGFRWHDLRHTFASWLVQDGVPLDRVSKLLGHKSLTMTMRYAHVAPNQLHEDVALLTKNSTPIAPASEPVRVVRENYLN